MTYLKSARRNRETYIGPWLPDPIVEEEEIEDVASPLMLALERPSPLERAAFLLHDVFGLEFAEVAAAIQRDEPTCRQLAHRARTHVRAEKPRFKVERQRGLELREAFFAASRGGDAKALGRILADDVSSLEADGEIQTTALEIDRGKIVAIYVVRNPDKLKHLH